MFSQQRYSAVPGAVSSLLLNAVAVAVFLGAPLLILLRVAMTALDAPALPAWATAWLPAAGWVGSLVLGLASGAALGALAVLRSRPVVEPTPGSPAAAPPPERFPDEYELNVPEEVLVRAADPREWANI